MAKAKTRARLYSVDLAPETAGNFVRENEVFAPCEGDPVIARGWYDSQKRWRRFKAAWADGWKVTISIRLDGSYSVSWGIKLTTQKDVA